MTEDKFNVFIIWENEDLIDIYCSRREAEKALAPGQEIEPAILTRYIPCGTPEPTEIPF